MNKTIEYSLPPEIAFDQDQLSAFLTNDPKALNFTGHHFRMLKRSIDARGRQVKVNVIIEFYQGDNLEPGYKIPQKNVKNGKPVIIVGAGPAGMFAALRLVELGYKPVVLERGKDVRTRRRDLAAINKENIVNPDSNYCFGEGGAGTYSDGKLYTRSKKRGDVRRILEIFVAHGAGQEILIDTHPHIGTNKLPGIVQNIRNSILEAGGEISFDTRVEDFILEQGEIKGVITAEGKEITGLGVILATGHSARDIFYLLDKKKIHIEFKPFALGVRVEHRQSLIDQIQYHCESRGDYLPASSYALVSQVKVKGVEKGVFSFCMCPGGFIVPSATEPGEIVVNGMSPSRRDSKYANSGIVVSVGEEDIKEFKEFGPLAGLEYQRSVERKACELAGNTQMAPGQLMVDFIQKKVSGQLLDTSYQPGLSSVSMDEVLPSRIAEYLREGFKDFGKKMKGYVTNDAQIIGVESRTSSPVKVPRNPESLEHVNLRRFFPCGEGAGYAGGIVSAAMDGERCAEKLIELYG